MWVQIENGGARNLSLAHKIDFMSRYNKVAVYATFPVCTGKNTADPAFAETAILKTFDTEDAARDYISELVLELNDVDYEIVDDDDEDYVGFGDSGLFKGTVGEITAREKSAEPPKFVDTTDGVPF